MKKRILAMALTLAMLLSLLPAQVFATGPVIQGGIHTEHTYEPVTIPQPSETPWTPEVQTPEVQTPSQTQEEQSAQIREEATQVQEQFPENQQEDSSDPKPPKRNTASGCTSDHSNYTALTNESRGSLSSGNYYLTADITEGADVRIGAGQTVTICLNGHDWNLDSYCAILINGGVLNICNCKESGKINGEGSSPILVKEGELYLNNVSVACPNDYAITIDPDVPSYISISGGEIGGIYFDWTNVSSTLNIAGDTVIDGGNGYYPGDIVIDSNPNVRIRLDESFLYTDAFIVNPIYLEYDMPLQLTDQWVAGTRNPFYPIYNSHNTDKNGNGYYIYESGGQLFMNQGSHQHDGFAFATEMTSASLSAGSYYLSGDLTVGSDISISSGTVNLCLNGHTLNIGGIKIKVSGGAILNICDCQDAGSIVGSFDDGVIVNAGGTFNLYGGTIENTMNYYAVSNTSGTTVIYGGTVINKGTTNFTTAYIGGGNVEVRGGVIGRPQQTVGYGIQPNKASAKLEIFGGAIYGAPPIRVSDASKVGIYGGILDGASTEVEMNNRNVLHLSGAPTTTTDSFNINLGSALVYIDAGFAPGNQVYTVQKSTNPSATTPYVQITENWGSNKGSATAANFKSTNEDLYGVIERNVNGKIELYLTLRRNITLTYDTAHGQVHQNVTKALEGDYIQFDVYPYEGYEFESISGIYTEGGVQKELVFTNQYPYFSAAMPAADVTITATFKQLHTHPMIENGESVTFATELTESVLIAGTYGYELPKGDYVLNAPLDLSSLDKPVVVTGPVNLCLKGNTLNLGTNRIEVWSGGILNICDCEATGTITGTHETGTVYNYAGTLNVHGGTISGSTAAIYNSSTTTIYGGTITGTGNAPVVNNSGTVEISGGTVTGGGTAATVINANTTLISGGTISGGLYGVQHVGNSLSMSGAPVINGTSACIYLAEDKVITVTDKLEGEGSYSVLTEEEPGETNGNKVLITQGWSGSGNTGTIPFTDVRNTYSVGQLNASTTPAVSDNLNEVYLYTPIYKVIIDPSIQGGTVSATPTEGTEGTYVLLTVTPADGFTMSSISATYVDKNGDTQTVDISTGDDANDPLYGFGIPTGDVTVTATFGHTHYMNADTTSPTLPDDEAAAEVFFKQMLDSSFTGGTLTTGDYVLTGPITATSNITISGTVNLCLNGQTLDLGSNQLTVNGSGALHLCDCRGGGKLTSANTTAAVLLDQRNAKLYMYGGTINATKGHGASLGNTPKSNNGFLYLYGGTIDAANSGTYIARGCVYAYSDAVTIKAGEYAIYSMEDYWNRGIYLYASPNLEGKTADFYLHRNVRINVMEKLEDNALYSIALDAAPSKGTKRQLTNYWGAAGNQANNGVFYSVNGYRIFLDSEELWIERHIHTLADGSEIEYNIPLTEEFISTLDTQHRVPVGNYVLVGDVETTVLHFKGNGQSHLCLCGYTLTTNGDNADASFYSDEGASLRIDDCQETGVINATCVQLLGNITLHEGNIVVNQSTYDIGVVNFRSNGVFVMEGGSITIEDMEYASGGYLSKVNAAQRFTSGEINAENWGVYVDMNTYLSGDPVITSAKGDFAIMTNWGYTIIIEGALNPGDEVYTVDTDVPPANYTNPIQITTGWENSGLASTDTSSAKIPFESVQGYAVVEMINESTGKKELYLVMPEVNCEAQPTQGGTVVADPASSIGGTENVQITITANPGYEFKSVNATYVDRLGQTQTVELTDKGNGIYTFTMPAAHVTVKAIYAELHYHEVSKDCTKYEPIDNENNVIFEVGISSAEDLKSYIVKDDNGNDLYYALPQGNYVLLKDVATTLPIVIPDGEEVNLCLNGKTLTLNGGSIEVEAKGKLNICDCSHKTDMDPYGAGKILSTGNHAIQNAGTLRIYSGTVKCTSDLHNAISHTDGTVDLYFGQIWGENHVGILSDADAQSVTIHDGFVYGGQSAIRTMSGSSCTVTVHDGKILGGNILGAPTEADFANAPAIDLNEFPGEAAGTKILKLNSYGILNEGSGNVDILGGTVSGGDVTGDRLDSASGGIRQSNSYGIYNGSTGTVTVKSGTVRGGSASGGEKGDFSGTYGINNAGGGSVVVEGGTVSGGDARALHSNSVKYDDCNSYGISNSKGTVTVSAGLVTSGTTSGNDAAGYGIFNGYTVEGEAYGLNIIGSVRVQGTTSGISNLGDACINGKNVQVTGEKGSGIYNAGTAHLVIKDGTVTGKNDGSSGIGNTGTATVEIHNGTIVGTTGIFNDSTSSSAVVIRDETDTGSTQILGRYSGINTVDGVVTIDQTNAVVKGNGVGASVNGKATMNMSKGLITVEGEYFEQAIYNSGTTNISGGKVTLTSEKRPAVHNIGKLTISGTAVVEQLAKGENNGTCVANFEYGQVQISGGTVTGSGYGVSNTANGTVDISGGSVLGGNYGLYCTAQDAAENSTIETKAHTTVVGGTIEGGLNGIYVEDGTVTVTGGTAKGGNYGLYMAGGVFNLGKEPTIHGNDYQYADIWFSSGCRTTIIEPITLGSGSENPAWSVLTEDEPTLDVPVPFTFDWSVKGNDVMKGEEKDFRTDFFTSKYYDVQLHIPEGEEDLEVVLAISNEVAYSTLTFYQWAGHQSLVTKAQIFEALDRHTKNEQSLMFNRDFTHLTEENVKSFYVCDKNGNGFHSPTTECYWSDGSNALWIRIQAPGYYRQYLHITYEVTVTQGVVENRTEIIPIVIAVYSVEPSVFVLDYGLNVKLTENNALYSSDKVSLLKEYDTATLEAISATEPGYNDGFRDYATFGIEFTPINANDLLAPAKGTYGTYDLNKEEDGSISAIYTPSEFMEGEDAVYVAMRVYDSLSEPGTTLGVADPTKEVEMFKKVSVLPANVVYYEDDFASVEWTEDTSVAVITSNGSSKDKYQGVDQSTEYGQDGTYEFLPENYVGSGGSTKVMEFKASGEVLSFSFTGTGFDLIGRTTADSGTFIYQLFSVTDGSLVKSGALDTVYVTDGGGIEEVPLLHVQDLPYDEYRFTLRCVATYDWDSEGEWTWNEALGTYIPPVIPSYLYFDGVRIYNPLAMTDENRENYNGGEKTAQFLHLRKLIVNGQAAAAKLEDGKFSFGSGAVSYVEGAREGMWYEGNAVSSLNDYLTAGPNNEVYFNANTQSVVLYTKVTGENPMLQIAIRNLNPEAFDKAEQDTYAPKLLVLGLGGKVLQTLVSDQKAISYTEQYYTINFTDCVKENLNGEEYYRVVLSAGNSSAFSLTNLKVNDVEFYTIPASASTYKYNSNGELIESDNPNATEMPNLQQLAWQLQAANGYLPEDDTEIKTDKNLKFRSISLSLQSSIGMNFYVANETLEGYTDPYVKLVKTGYNNKESKEEVVTLSLEEFEEVTVQEMKNHVFRYDDITAKEMTSTVQVTLFAKKDGVEVEGETREYSVQQYAKNMLSKTNDQAFMTLLVDMLNYGTEAQKHFDYNNNTNGYVHANDLGDEFKEYVEMGTVETPVLNSRALSEGTDDYAFKMAGISLLLKEKVEVNYFVKLNGGDFTDTKLVVTYLDITGNTVIKTVPYSTETFRESGDYYKVTFDGLNATEMRTLFTAWIEDKDGMRVSNALTYSIESYAASMLASEAAEAKKIHTLLTEMMQYGDSAAAYFAKPGIEATMIQPWLYLGDNPWDQARWNKEFSLMKELGMKSLILQNVVNLDFKAQNNEGDFYCIYPTKLDFGTPKELYTFDSLKLIFEAAKANNMTVYIGTVGDSRWFDYGTGTVDGFAQWSETNQAQQVAVMEEIMELYGTAYGEQIAGWYYHNEIWNVDGFHNGTELQTYTDALVENINTVIDGAGSRPLMISPYFNITVGSAASYAEWWTEVFKDVNFRQGDIFVPQDTVGKDGDSDIRMDQWIAALARAARNEPGLEFWVNNECFRESNGSMVPAPAADFIDQYMRSDLYSKKHILFSWNHYYNPALDSSYKTNHDALKAFLNQ